VKATEVTAGLAESNGSLLPGMWRDSFHVTCGLTACTPGSAPGPTLGNEYGKTLPLPFLHFTERLCHYPPKYQRFILQQSFSPNTSLIKGLHGIRIIPTINLLFSVRFATGYIHSFWRNKDFHSAAWSGAVSGGMRYIECPRIVALFDCRIYRRSRKQHVILT